MPSLFSNWVELIGFETCILYSISYLLQKPNFEVSDKEATRSTAIKDAAIHCLLHIDKRTCSQYESINIAYEH